MGTRGLIAQGTPNDWYGVFNAIDSHKNWLGLGLLSMYRGHFKRDLDLMLKTIINDHPEGWFRACGDWHKTPVDFAIWGDRDEEGLRKSRSDLRLPPIYFTGNETQFVYNSQNMDESLKQFPLIYLFQGHMLHVCQPVTDNAAWKLAVIESANIDARAYPAWE